MNHTNEQVTAINEKLISMAVNSRIQQLKLYKEREDLESWVISHKQELSSDAFSVLLHAASELNREGIRRCSLQFSTLQGLYSGDFAGNLQKAVTQLQQQTGDRNQGDSQ